MMALGILLAVLGGCLQGTFAIFLRHRRSWQWENLWLIYSITALLIFPVIWVGLSVPHPGKVLAALTLKLILPPMLLGCVWGIGSILFGLALERIGMALTFTIVVGLCSAIGTTAPLFLAISLPAAGTLRIFAVALLIMLAGISMAGYAGFLREKHQNAASAKPRGVFFYGLLLAIASGTFSSMSNVGFVYGSGIGTIAMRFGASASNATLPIMAIVFFGGFLVNAGYALLLLRKNKSFGKFSPGGTVPLIGSIAAGIFWFGGVGLYGISSTYLGYLGTSVGFALCVTSTILAGNLSGIIAGEWTGTKRALMVQLFSSLILIVGAVTMLFSL